MLENKNFILFVSSKFNFFQMCTAACVTSAASAVTCVLFYRVNPDAAYLAIPYCLWSAFYGLFTFAMTKSKGD